MKVENEIQSKAECNVTAKFTSQALRRKKIAEKRHNGAQIAVKSHYRLEKQELKSEA